MLQAVWDQVCWHQIPHLSSLPALRCFACLEALSSIFRQLNIGPFSFALNHVNLDPSMPLQSFSCSSMPLFALDYLHLESVLLLKSSARLGSSLFELDLLHLCVIFLLRSYARLDLPTVVSDQVHNLSPATWATWMSCTCQQFCSPSLSTQHLITNCSRRLSAARCAMTFYISVRLSTFDDGYFLVHQTFALF